ncbi:MAG TPA: alpha-L-rhamnosidase C-terminal domain-containing protein [Draconibacterium sp.]|nr:alpha-L-rhamnosidase C-terminal domain-containing protein [Draconibacterium sp.]
MFGEIGAWFYKGIGGIFPDAENPGFKNIILKPNFISSLDHFEASHDGPNGKIISKWGRNGENTVYNVTVPPNSMAVLYLLSESILEPEKVIKMAGVKSTESSEFLTKIILESGNYTFNIH